MVIRRELCSRRAKLKKIDCDINCGVRFNGDGILGVVYGEMNGLRLGRRQLGAISDVIAVTRSFCLGFQITFR